ncbi:alpha/beta fold hydrolase [Halomonas sp. HP20-15]|uniref:alpha/beta fold hydrolase n=1 Tax=Halomonas sp. HP20-15 TaxID=3085901 RepID=UPI0029822FA7|nr:alpha/beta fold hydrolase [Halomonas sp. HP20-15]MDW5375810.1 alpha/beta fold hydrolase [Halomonas sp. HP20-15]
MDSILLALGVVLLMAIALGLWGLRRFSVRVARRAEADVPPAGRFVDTPGGRVHLVEAGQGPPLVLIHGLGGQLQHFTYALTERLADDFHVIAVDRPGSGYSERGANGAGLAAQARQIRDAWHALGVERPLLVGHSLGGAVALALAEDYPDEVAGLALLAPLTAQESEVPPAFRGMAIRSPRWRRFVADTFAVPLGLRYAARMLAGIFAPEPVPADFALRGGGLLALRPQAFYANSTDLMTLENDLPPLVRRYHELRLPAAILFGERDAILAPTRHGTAMRDKVPGLSVEILPDAGHMLPLTRPDETAALIRRMAARVGE